MNEQLRQAFRQHLLMLHECFEKVKTGTLESGVRATDAYKSSTAWLLRFVKESSVEDVWEAFSDTDVLILSPAVMMIQETSFEFTEVLLRKIQSKLVEEDHKGFVSALVELLPSTNEIELKSESPTPSWAKYTNEQRQNLRAILAGTVPAVSADSKEAEEQKSLLDGTQPITSQYIFDFDGVITFRNTGWFWTNTVTGSHYISDDAADRFIKNQFLYVLDKKPDNFEPYKNGYVLCKDSWEVYCYNVNSQKPCLITFRPSFGKGKEKPPLIAWNDFLREVMRWHQGPVNKVEKEGHSHEQAQLTVIESKMSEGKFPLRVGSIKRITGAISKNNVYSSLEPVAEIIEEAVKENIRPGVAEAFRKIWDQGGSIVVVLAHNNFAMVKAHLEAAGLTPEEIVKIRIQQGDNYLLGEFIRQQDLPLVYFSSKEDTEYSRGYAGLMQKDDLHLAWRHITPEPWPQDPKASTAISDQTKTDSLQFWVRLKEHPKIFLPRPVLVPTWREAVVNYFYHDHPTRTVVSVLVGLALLALLFSPAGPAFFAFAGFLSLPIFAQAVLAFVGGFLFSHAAIMIHDRINGGIVHREFFRGIEGGVRGLSSLTMQIPGIFAWFFGNYAIEFFVAMAKAFVTGSLWQGIFYGIATIVLGTLAAPFVAMLAVSAAVFYGLGIILQGLGKYFGYVFAELILNIGKKEEPYTINTIRALGRGLLAIPLLPFFVMRKVGEVFSDLAKGIYELGKNFFDEKKWTESFSDNFENVAVSPVVKLAPWEREIALKEVALREKQGEVISTKDKDLAKLIQCHGLWETPYDMAKATVEGKIVSTSPKIP